MSRPQQDPRERGFSLVYRKHPVEGWQFWSDRGNWQWSAGNRNYAGWRPQYYPVLRYEDTWAEPEEVEG